MGAGYSMKTYEHIIVILSVCSIALLTIVFVLLSSVGPLEQNKPAHNLVTEVLSKDPKVQRGAAKGNKVNLDQIATEVLSFLNQYIYYPLIATGFSLVLSAASLVLLKRNSRLSGSLLICAAISSFFTVIPPILQTISGLYLIKKKAV